MMARGSRRKPRRSIDTPARVSRTRPGPGETGAGPALGIGSARRVPHRCRRAGGGAGPLCALRRTLPRTVVLEDDGLFLMAGAHLGVAHPPGYPLYTLIVHLFTRLPWADAAFLGHVSSAVLGALACGALCCCARLLASPLPALTAAWLFGVSEQFWSQAIARWTPGGQGRGSERQAEASTAGPGDARRARTSARQHGHSDPLACATLRLDVRARVPSGRVREAFPRWQRSCLRHGDASLRRPWRADGRPVGERIVSTPEIISLFGVVLAMVWALYREIRLGRTEVRTDVVQLVNAIRAEIGERIDRVETADRERFERAETANHERFEQAEAADRERFGQAELPTASASSRRKLPTASASSRRKLPTASASSRRSGRTSRPTPLWRGPSSRPRAPTARGTPRCFAPWGRSATRSARGASRCTTGSAALKRGPWRPPPPTDWPAARVAGRPGATCRSTRAKTTPHERGWNEPGSPPATRSAPWNEPGSPPATRSAPM